MQRFFLFIILLCTLATITLAQGGGPPVRVQTADGVTSSFPVRTIKFPNGTLSCTGGSCTYTGGGGGSVTGPGSSTDNAIARFDGTGGVVLQNSVVTVGDTGIFSGSTIGTGNTLGDVTVNVIGTDATGDIYYRDSGGLLTRLAIGSATNVLRVSGGLPSWAAAGSGAPFSDASALVKNGSDATKLAIFSAASISTGTTRTFTLPNTTDTLAVLGAQTFTAAQKISSTSATAFQVSPNSTDAFIIDASRSSSDTGVKVTTGQAGENAFIDANGSLGGVGLTVRPKGNGDLTLGGTGTGSIVATIAFSGVTTARTTGAPTYYFRTVAPADTGLTASTETVGNQFGGSTSAATVTRQHATGALATQRENLFVAPTYSFVGASTLTSAATVAIDNAPVAGTNATLTNTYALWVQNGGTFFNGTTNLFKAQSNTTASFEWQNSSGTRLAAMDASNGYLRVGAGTSNPANSFTRLVAVTAGAANIAVYDSSDGSEGVYFAGSSGIIYGSQTNHDILFNRNGSTIWKFTATDVSPNSDGAVDLGTTSVQWRQLYIDQTITAGGTTGNQTINKAAGTVNFAAAATAITVTDSLVSTSSLIFVEKRTNDVTCQIQSVVPGSGSFVINMTAGCAAETSVGFFVVNK